MNTWEKHIITIPDDTWEEHVACVQQRTGFYLETFEGQRDAAGCYLNFLHMALNQDVLGAPTRIDFVSHSTHHSAYAYGCRIPIDYHDTANVCDWAHSQIKTITPQGIISSPLYPFGWLNPIVILSDYCILDLITPTEQIRQVFHKAMPITACEHNRISHIPDSVPYIGIHFMLNPQIFPVRTLSRERMLRAWKWWRLEHSNPRRTTTTTRFYLPLVPYARTRLKFLDNETFALRIQWSRLGM